MNIGIDGFEANIEKRVGIGQYAYQLLKSLYHLGSTNHYYIFLPTPPLSDMPLVREKWQYVVGKPGAFWTIRQLPNLIKKQSLDVFFSPTHYAPWFTKVPRVFSIMDLSYIHFPQTFRFKDLVQLKIMTAISVKSARKILAISEFTKKEIIDHYHVEPSNVVITYPGLREDLADVESVESGHVQVKYGLHKPYILFVSTIQPRKNLIRLIEAFEKMSTNVTLVLVGKKGWLYEPIFARIKSSPKHKHIVYLDFVKAGDLASLYQHAMCLALPSLYEGFGIPAVEALYFKCPVVVSNTTSLPEIVGDAGIYVDPISVDSIAEGLEKAVQLSQTEREKLVLFGYKQIRQFSWENCARKTLEVLNSVQS